MREMVHLPKGRGLEHHCSGVCMLINVIGSSGRVNGQMIRLLENILIEVNIAPLFKISVCARALIKK